MWGLPQKVWEQPGLHMAGGHPHREDWAPPFLFLWWVSRNLHQHRTSYHFSSGFCMRDELVHGGGIPGAS